MVKEEDDEYDLAIKERKLQEKLAATDLEEGTDVAADKCDQHPEKKIENS